jgi:pyruvate/2-oxoglutarate dehydrogenase complex dihydrolipoamide dehydrogenase (E3) component
VTVSYTDKDGEQEIVFDKLIVAVGRRPCSKACLQMIVAFKWISADLFK